MPGAHEYRLKIDAFSVDSLPMSRLAEYLTELAQLLGEKERVHFSRIEAGSAVLVSRVEAPTVPKVEARIAQVRDGSAPEDAMKAYKALDDLLAKDNAIAALTTGDGAEVIDFPGRTRPRPACYGPFREGGSLDGVIIRLGGRDKMVPVLLRSAENTEYSCWATIELSKRLAAHYLGAMIRVHGRGKWMREESGNWTLQRFDISRFEVLDDSPLGEVVARLRAIGGTDWGRDAALGDIAGLRTEEGTPH